MPDNIRGRQEAEKFAAELAAREGVKVCLSVPGEQDVWFDEKGMVVFRLQSRQGGNTLISLDPSI